ncbi:hypothetical protein [Alkalihalobacillus sp. AL-G]|uniref:hypothetical protein n=1 Tax=Alkalihalobacillus sp. AL-G TaxID=2926399 RepID=UPI00272B3928|nr:hypothetical protein [Alkalihalobacillus sp. AL-G]WLD94525.1 hypothetical protein MOJ78_06470 [Alkalihalobacillus sp. AL-G]
MDKNVIGKDRPDDYKPVAGIDKESDFKNVKNETLHEQKATHSEKIRYENADEIYE